MTDSTAAPGQATQPGRCSNCNARLPDTPVSLCPYCAMPILSGATPAAGGAESPNAGRIARIRAHEDFADAEAWSPPEDVAHQEGARRAFHGKTALVAAAVLAVAGFLTSSTFANAAFVLAALAAALGVWLIVTGAGMRKRALGFPLLRRPGLILDRRSETEIGTWTGRTTYFFTIELEGGVVAEFAYPGRGSHEDPYVNGLPGVAYTRGQTLLHFRHVRV